MPIKYLFVFLVSFFLGLAFISLLKRVALRYKSLRPKGIPLIGGIAMGLSFLITSLIAFAGNANLSAQVAGLMIASAIMLIWGVIDDLRELSISAKFLAQIIATTLLIFFGIKIQMVFFGALPNLLITYIWVLAITNAFNHLDILDGLAGGTAILVSLAFSVISFLNGDFKSVILSLALIGAAAAFLIHNLPPAKIYMGNSGSHFLGFVLAAVAIVISYAPLERKIALLSPLLILGLPILDTAFLIFIRLLKRKSPFKKSDDHIAIRFLRLGFSEGRTLLFMLLLCLFCRASNLSGIAIAVLAILAGLIITYKIGRVPIDG